MEAVAVLVGLFGLSSSLGAVVLARRREFGMLRHLGLTRRQIAAMLAAEGGLLAALGALAGLVTGAAISLVLVFVVNRQSFNWGMEMHFPCCCFCRLRVVLVVLSVLTAVLSGQRSDGHGPGARGAGGLVMRRRAFLGGLTALPLRFLGRHRRLSARHAQARTSSFRATTARIPSSAPSGGTSPAGSTARSVSRSRSSARGRKSRATTRAASTRGRSSSRTRRSPIRSAASCCTDQRAARAGFSLAHAELDRTGVWVDDWRLELEGDRYQAQHQRRGTSSST